VLVLHTLPPAECSAGRVVGEFDLADAATNVGAVLKNAIVAGVRGEAEEILYLAAEHRPDVIFNLCEAPLGQPCLESHAAALFEWLRIPFTGSGSETLALCRRKDRINAVMASHGVPIPGVSAFPRIVKPADEDGSAGISVDSICLDEESVALARKRWPGPVVVQEFLPGREFVVSLWGRDEPSYVSIGETLFRNGLRLITYAAKWDINSPEFADSPLDYRTELDSSLREAIKRAAQGAWLAARARGYLRVDVRCDAVGNPFVLDVNPNPELGPGVGICRAVQEAGWTWEFFVHSLVEWAVVRPA
jgi:D-alanine-D-alanine ligase